MNFRSKKKIEANSSGTAHSRRHPLKSAFNKKCQDKIEESKEESVKKSKTKTEENKEDGVKKVKKKSKGKPEDKEDGSGSPKKKVKKKKMQQDGEDETDNLHSPIKKAKKLKSPVSASPSPKFSVMTESQRQKLSEYLKGPRNISNETNKLTSDPSHMSAFQEAFMKTLIPENEDYQERSEMWNKIKHSQTISKNEYSFHEKEEELTPEANEEHSPQARRRQLFNVERSLSPPLLPLSGLEKFKVKEESMSSPLSVLVPNMSNQQQVCELSPPLLSPLQLDVKPDKEDFSPPILSPSKPNLEVVKPKLLGNSYALSTKEKSVPTPQSCLQGYPGQLSNFKLSQSGPSSITSKFHEDTSGKPLQSFYQVIKSEKGENKRTHELVTINQGTASGGTVFCTDNFVHAVSNEFSLQKPAPSQINQPIQIPQNPIVFRGAQPIQSSQEQTRVQAKPVRFSFLTNSQKRLLPKQTIEAKSSLGEQQSKIQYSPSKSGSDLVLNNSRSLQTLKHQGVQQPNFGPHMHSQTVTQGMEGHHFTSTIANTTTTTSLCQAPLCLTRPATQSGMSVAKKFPVSTPSYSDLSRTDCSTFPQITKAFNPSPHSRTSQYQQGSIKPLATDPAVSGVIQNVTLPTQVFRNALSPSNTNAFQSNLILQVSKPPAINSKLKASPLLIQHLQQQVFQGKSSQINSNANHNGFIMTNASGQTQGNLQKLLVQPFFNKSQGQQDAICVTPKQPVAFVQPHQSPGMSAQTQPTSNVSVAKALVDLSNGLQEKTCSVFMQPDSSDLIKSTSQNECSTMESYSAGVSENHAVSSPSISPPSLECVKSTVKQHVWSRPPSLSPKPTEQQSLDVHIPVPVCAPNLPSSEIVCHQLFSIPALSSSDKGSVMQQTNLVVSCDNSKTLSVEERHPRAEKEISPPSAATHLHNPSVQKSLAKLIVSGDLRLYPGLFRHEGHVSTHQIPEIDNSSTQREIITGLSQVSNQQQSLCTEKRLLTSATSQQVRMAAVAILRYVDKIL